MRFYTLQTAQCVHLAPRPLSLEQRFMYGEVRPLLVSSSRPEDVPLGSNERAENTGNHEEERERERLSSVTAIPIFLLATFRRHHDFTFILNRVLSPGSPIFSAKNLHNEWRGGRRTRGRTRVAGSHTLPRLDEFINAAKQIIEKRSVLQKSGERSQSR